LELFVNCLKIDKFFIDKLPVCIKRKCYFEGIEESNKNVTQRPRKM